ncbi:MAG: molybdenum cofactor biosynthesis protein B [Alphaproteobacteria bacterium]|nr:molybdenum cofactor biosynthesis protein B [Alphaproteobacteria bacterium]
MFISNLDQSKTFVPLGIAVLAVSDTRTLATDTSGASLVDMAKTAGHTLIDRQVTTDDIAAIRAVVAPWLANREIDVVLTTGGTGFTPRDVTPEALEPWFEKKMEGFSVLFHQYSAAKIGTSTIQSRATAGLINQTLVFCLPGSRGACRDAWDGILVHQLDARLRPCNFIEILSKYSGAG